MTGAKRVSHANAKPPKRVLQRGAPAAPPLLRLPKRPQAGAAAPSAAPAAEDAEAKKRAIIQAALERARKKKEELAAKGQGPLNTERVSADVQAQIDAAEARRRRLGLAADDTGTPSDKR